MFTSYARKGALVLSTVVLAMAVAACGQKTDTTKNAASSTSPSPSASAAPKLAGSIAIDGSSTVFPIEQAAAEEFMKKNKDVKITVAESGTSGGFKKIGNLEIDIAGASRPVKKEELDAVKAKGDDLVEIKVALDGLTVVVHKDNDWASEMTVAELKKIWDQDSKVKKWSDVRAGWPDQPIKLYGPGTQSGTFDYFTEAINGKQKQSRADYTASEDDNVLVKGVSADKYAMGYFGYGYFKENESKLKAIKIKVDDASPAIAPSTQTIETGTYKPLSRPLYIYVLKSKMSQPHIQEFLKYMNNAEGIKLIEQVKMVKLPDADYKKNLELIK